jgi:hypothetical protein
MMQALAVNQCLRLRRFSCLFQKLGVPLLPFTFESVIRTCVMKECNIIFFYFQTKILIPYFISLRTRQFVWGSRKHITFQVHEYSRPCLMHQQLCTHELWVVCNCHTFQLCPGQHLRKQCTDMYWITAPCTISSVRMNSLVWM